MGIRTGAPLMLLLFLAACASEAPSVQPEAEAPPAPTAPAIDPDRPIVLAFGDSLTNGLGVGRDMDYPAQLQTLIDDAGFPHQVVNYGNDGDTTAQGLARMGGALELEPDIVVLEFGGNDGLQGRGLEAMRQNLSTMIGQFRDAGATVVLAGISLPRNYGPDYIADFEQIYVDLAADHDVTLIPFLLEGLVDLDRLDAGELDLEDAMQYMQSDGTHPTGEGYTIVAATVFEAIEPFLAAGP